MFNKVYGAPSTPPVVNDTGGGFMDSLEGFGSILQGGGALIGGYGTLQMAGAAEDQLAWEKEIYAVESAQNREDYLFKRGKQELADALSAAKRNGASDEQLRQMEATSMEKLTIDNFERGAQQQQQNGQQQGLPPVQGGKTDAFGLNTYGQAPSLANTPSQPGTPQNAVAAATAPAPTNYMQQPASKAGPATGSTATSMAGYGKPNMTGTANQPRLAY